ncbi:helix-turn-helix domain-containing protein [Dysgonomonas sp. OttesenSCG-928-M03]|nr:helix-turn-helix domain-containing protein [Dysgonomonas sp. OttesenSCG-928-M03]
MPKIGKNIKKIRNIKGLSQQAFADLFELTRGNISSYEELRAEPRIETVVKIANYFSIPLSDFIEKELSVNELLHYDTKLVLEPEKLKIAQQMVRIPYIPALYLDDYVKQHEDENFLIQLPYITVPSASRSELLAIEIDNSENLPAGYNFQNGDILIFEKVIKENVHRIINRLGLVIDKEELHIGVYTEDNGHISLSLNEWVKYPFDIESGIKHWVLKGTYTHII